MKMFAILMTALMAIPAFADHHEGPCAKDRETLCASAKGHEAMHKCMKDNEAKLSTECKTHWEKKKEQMKDVKAACHEDAEKLCPDMDKKDLMKCMHSKKDQVSEACKNEWKELKDMKHGAK